MSDLEVGSPDAEPRPSRGGCVAFVPSSPRSLARARTCAREAQRDLVRGCRRYGSGASVRRCTPRGGELLAAAVDVRTWRSRASNIYGIFSALALVAVGVVIAKTFGESSFALVVVVVAAFGLGSNFVLGLLQQRDLIRAIGRILDVRQVR